MSWLSSFLHPGQGYDAASQQMQNYYNQGMGYQMPFMQQGQSAYGNLSEAMKNLLDPQALQSKWMESYDTSPEAKQLMEQAQAQGMDAASSMGLLGSSSAISGIQKKASDISSADRQQYLNDLMQKYMAGAGLAQNIYGTGAQTAGQMGQNAMTMGQNMGQMAYGKQNAGGGLFGGLLGLGGSILGSALAGPIGGALAGGLSQKMGWTPWQGGK